jgi:ribosomal protein L1
MKYTIAVVVILALLIQPVSALELDLPATPKQAELLMPDRTDTFGNVQGIIGNVAFTEEQLLENLEAFMATILKVKPSTVKGDYIKNIAVSTTMGPGIKIITNSFDK